MDGGYGARGKPFKNHIGALRIKAQPVDHAAVGFKAEDPRARIAGLRQRRDGADFDEAKADAKERVGHLGVLVEARRHPDRIGKIQREGAYREPFVVGNNPEPRNKFEHFQRQAVGVFRIQRSQQRPNKPVEQADHDSSSGNTRRPSISSASGRAHFTAASGSGA